MLKTKIHCCGSGSGFGCLFVPWIRDGRKSAFGSGMNNPDHIFRAKKPLVCFFGGKILKLFDEDPGWRQFGSGMEKSQIRDKHPGSATLKNLANSAKKKKKR